MTHALTRRVDRLAPVAAAVAVAVALAAPGAASAQSSSAPTLRADGYDLSWTGGPSTRGRGYELRETGSLRTRTQRIRGRSFTPAPQSGSRVTFRVRVRGSRSWSRPVRISYLRPGFLGMSGNPATDDRRTLQTMLAAGSRTVKQNISFATVEPVRGQRRWGDLDARMSELDRLGFNVLLQLDGYSEPPAWARGRPSAFRSFVRAVAKRYGPGTAADVTWIEPMNEPYYDRYARGGKVSISRFAQDWVRTVQAGRRGNPDVRFMMPANTQVNDRGTWKDWITATRRAQPRLSRYVDGVALHPYTSGLSPAVRPSRTVSELRAFSRIDRVRASMRRNGLRVPAFITELGWATANASTVENEFHPIQSPETQAAYLRETVRQVQNRRWISGIWFYSWRDYGEAGRPHDSTSTMGVMGFRWQPKPSYDWWVSEMRRRGNR